MVVLAHCESDCVVIVCTGMSDSEYVLETSGIEHFLLAEWDICCVLLSGMVFKVFNIQV